MLNVTRVATVGEAASEPTDQTQAAVDLSQQQRTRVRGDVATVEASHHRAPINRFKFKQRRATLCLHWGAPWLNEKPLLHNDSLRISAPMHLSCVRNPG